ncbi:MAG TPA: ELM1/GtrOC1 family putative glycosyltransferase [Desulfotignum sp.]|nr:ELM1/GtrOC1 family putative glycosyltransferase [Desulfotignum sp.]
MQKLSPLSITAFYDTRPGHVKQTRGLLQALRKFTPVQASEVVLPDYNLSKIFQDWMGFMGIVPAEKKKSDQSKPDLILGTGTHTHIPMLLHRRRYGGKVVTCMTPEWPLAKHMDLCFIPEHDAPKAADNIIATMGPPNTAVNRNTHDPMQGLVVIGGTDSKTHHWDNEKMADLVRRIVGNQPHIFWTLSTSPRTPREMVPMLADIAEDCSGTQFVPFEQTGSGWIENQYAASSAVWVSADSVSMVYEALSAGCRVGILPVEWKKKGVRLDRAIALLEKDKKIVSFASFMQDAAYPDHSLLNEAQRCATVILERWWPERLQ